jgi:hypothetical protein
MNPGRFAVGARPLRPEQELLLCCARVTLESHHREHIAELLHADLSWDFLNQEATRHAILPLVYHHLRGAAAHHCPESVLREWHANALAVHLTGLSLSAELLALASLFRQEGVPLLAFKGPVAAVALYGDLGLRPCLDLDVLVPRTSAGTAGALLVRRGYTPYSSLSRDWEEVLFRLYSERIFLRDQPAGVIDLHWRLLPPGYSFTPAPKALWDRAEAVALGPGKVHTLGPEDMLVFFCLHGAKHGWAQLNWLCDLAQLIRARPGLDWDRVLSWAAARGARRLVQTGLQLAHDLLEAPLPSDVVASGRNDRRVAALVHKAITDHMFPEVAAPARRPWPWETFFFKAMERSRDRWRCIHVMIIEPGPQDWCVLRLPAACAPLYYIIRPVRILLGACSGRRG